MVNALACVALLGIGLTSPPVLAAEPPDASEIAQYEQVLKAAKISLEDPALLAVFRTRTISDKERATLADKVRQLGARLWKAREKASADLVRAGRPALPLLQRALRDPDLEVSHRAERCIAEIENQTSEAPLLQATAHLLAARKSKDAAQTMLAYLPSANEDLVIEAVHEALALLTLSQGKAAPVLVAALTDHEPSRRCAAAFVLGRAETSEQKRLRPLLQDRDDEVRFQAAAALLRGGDRSAVPILVDLLATAPMHLASQAEDYLYRLADANAPSTALGSDSKSRENCRIAWRDWWKQHGERIDLKKLNVEAAYLGLTLVCEAHLPNGSGRVFERGPDGKVRWEITVYNPIDAQYLSGDRLLIANCNGNQVLEMDRQGKTHWKYDVSSPVAVQRLSNGNTFIGTYQAVLEVTRDGKVLYNYPRNKGGSLYYAQKQRNGHILCIHGNGLVCELDTTGKEVLAVNIGGTAIWGGIEVLPSGRLLVAKSSTNTAVEIDRQGKELWSCSVHQPLSATRLRNGNTLLTSYQDRTVTEVDRNGKEVWKLPLKGLPFRARRR